MEHWTHQHSMAPQPCHHATLYKQHCMATQPCQHATLYKRHCMATQPCINVIVWQHCTHQCCTAAQSCINTINIFTNIEIIVKKQLTERMLVGTSSHCTATVIHYWLLSRKLLRDGWSAYVLSCACKYHLELNWAEEVAVETNPWVNKYIALSNFTQTPYIFTSTLKLETSDASHLKWCFQVNLWTTMVFPVFICVRRSNYNHFSQSLWGFLQQTVQKTWRGENQEGLTEQENYHSDQHSSREQHTRRKETEGWHHRLIANSCPWRQV